MAKDFRVKVQHDSDPGRDLDIVDVDIDKVKQVLVIYKFVGWVKLKNGRKKRVSRETAVKALKKLKQPLLPAGCDKVVTNIKNEDIKNVLFLYTSVAYVRLFTGRMLYIPREQADEFLETSGDFLDRGVDQPWNDRRTFNVPFSDIIMILKKGPKHTARVLTRDGPSVLVTREHAEAFEQYVHDKYVREVVNPAAEAKAKAEADAGFSVKQIADDDPRVAKASLQKKKARRH